MRSLVRHRFVALLGVLALAFGAGCGEPREPGGSGRLSSAQDGVRVLEVAGSPYEMGWWHGYLLRDRILELHAAWEQGVFEAILGPRGGEAGGAREALERHLDLCLDQTLHNWLSESMLQELNGMASGCGLAAEQLLRLDVLRDALRWKGLSARLVGAAGLLPLGGGAYETRAWWSGPDTKLLDHDWLIVRRQPESGPVTVVLSWPGSLGAVAGLRADGLSYLSAEGEVTNRKRMGFGGGRPFFVVSREMLEESKSAYDLIAEAKGTMGHVMLSTSVHRHKDDVVRVHALAAFQVYGLPDPEWFLDRLPFLAIGPYERLDSPDAVALRESTGAADLEPDERWLRLKGHADPSGASNGVLPGVRVGWSGGAGTIEVVLPGNRSAKVTLEP